MKAVNTPRRKVAALSALALTAVVGIGVALGSTGTVSATDDTTPASTEFTVVGDGSLPTTKPELGQSRSALSTQEVGYALHLASTDSSIPATATDVTGGPGPEFLFADLPEDVDAGGRTAEVMLYDYAGNTAYQQLVDLKAGKVVTSQTASTLQPATSSDEADKAMEIALAGADTLTFKKEFEAAQGVPLVSTDQVVYVAGTFVYDGTTKAGKECGVDRCAQLMVQTASGGYLNTFDFVVNLSKSSIVEFK